MFWAGLGVHELKREQAILEFEVPARSEVVVSLLNDGARISEAGEQSAAVNVVEGAAIVPVVFCVGDFEFAVYGDIVGLNGGEVSTGNTGGGVLLGWSIVSTMVDEVWMGLERRSYQIP